MARYKCTVEYLGTDYCGWQIQNNAITIQQVLEENLTELLKQKIKITASGRTDSGVHAKGQVFHFDAETIIPPKGIPYACNQKLPDDISIKDCEIVSDDFHSRFNPKNKTYSYSLYVSNHKSPLLNKTHVKIGKNLNLDKLYEVAELLKGEHDFKAFMSTGSDVKGTVRTIYNIDIKCYENVIKFYICGNGFLYNMVRIMVGTMVDYSYSKLTKNNIYDIFKIGDRNLAGKTFPAHGLCLERVEY